MKFFALNMVVITAVLLIASPVASDVCTDKCINDHEATRYCPLSGITNHFDCSASIQGPYPKYTKGCETVNGVDICHYAH